MARTQTERTLPRYRLAMTYRANGSCVSHSYRVFQTALQSDVPEYDQVLLSKRRLG